MSKKLLQHTILFSLFVLLAQVFGLVRDLYLVRYFGVGPILDTYYLAFKIPDFLNVFYSVFLGSVIFIPLLTQARHEKGDEGVVENIQKVGSMVLVFVLSISCLLYLVMPYLSSLLAPTWGVEQLALLTKISRTLLLAQLFFPLGILAGSLGMVYEKPLGMAGAGAVYNIVILFFAIVLAPMFGIFGVVYGVIIGSCMFTLMQIHPKVVREKLGQFKFIFAVSDWVFFFKRNFGRFISVLLNQTFWLSVLALASLAGVGAVTIFQNSFNIYLAIFFIVGASFSTAMMPTSSKLHIEGNHDELRETLLNSLVYMFAVSVFIATGAFFFAYEIISIVYYFSHLRDVDLHKMSSVFALLTLSIPLINTLEISRKYMYTTNMIGSSVAIMLVFLPTMFAAFFIQNLYPSFFGTQKLIYLSVSILIANLFAVIAVLILLQFQKRLDIKKVLQNVYKIILLPVLTFIFLVIIFSSFSISNFENSYGHFLGLVLKVFVFCVLYFLSILILGDEISKTVLKTLKSLVIKNK